MGGWVSREEVSVLNLGTELFETAARQSVHDCWPSIRVNHSAMRRLLSIYIVLTVIIHEKTHEYLVVAL
jgi:hypothetical protein